jgi:parallel beta-helix repeat protein
MDTGLRFWSTNNELPSGRNTEYRLPPATCQQVQHEPGDIRDSGDPSWPGKMQSDSSHAAKSASLNEQLSEIINMLTQLLRKLQQKLFANNEDGLVSDDRDIQSPLDAQNASTAVSTAPQAAPSSSMDQPASAPPGGSGVSATSPSSPAASSATKTDAPKTAPAGALDASKFGVSTDNPDNTEALNKAFAAAKQSGQAVYIPEGTYQHSGVLKADGINITGAGPGTVLKATNPDQAALELSGDGGSISNLKTEVTAPNRSSQPEAAAILLRNASNATVSNVTTQGAASNGIRLDNSHDCTIENNLVQGSDADGITALNGSSGTKIKNNVVFQAGDDGISGTSYPGDAGGQVSDTTVEGNMVVGSRYGRGIAFMGTANSTIQDNTINGVPGQGVAVGSDPNSGTMANGGGNSVSGNNVVNEYDETDHPHHSTPQVPQSVYNAAAQLKSISSILGRDVQLSELADANQYNPDYAPGTGNGSNNSGGVRT